MYQQLKNIFPSTCIYKTNHVPLHSDYYWFFGKDQEQIGILKDDVTKKDYSLLTTFLKPYDMHFPPLTKTEKWWKNTLQSEQSTLNDPLKSSYRIVYFCFPKETVKPHIFKEAMQQLFEEPIIMLWEDQQTGIIIEKVSQGDDGISYQQIIDVLMTDLYTTIKFFIGPFHHHIPKIQSSYKNILTIAPIVWEYIHEHVVTYTDAIPAIMIDSCNRPLLQTLLHSIITVLKKDNDLIHMMEVFFKCNLNITHTAKKLYMHRNSLQYRIDKFHDKTGLDIRHFHHALTVYLAILMMREK